MSNLLTLPSSLSVVIEEGLAYGKARSPATPDAMTTTPPAAFDLDAFLRSVGRRAQVMAEISTRDREAALDIVQDSMLALASRYAARPPSEWGPLFQTILQSRITDWHRRRRRQGKWFTWLSAPDDDPDADPWADIPEQASSDPALLLERARDIDTVRAALADLPLRQQQAFMLRIWEGLDTAATAAAMACSEGSVKTHLSRALQMLRARLENTGNIRNQDPENKGSENKNSGSVSARNKRAENKNARSECVGSEGE
jgi:RNA polymerase sigma-70 factor (ECF subfamily)